MTKRTERRYTGKCIDCDSPLELYEIDYQKGHKTLQCTRCALYHFYNKNFFGKWKLVKASRVSDLWESSK